VAGERFVELLPPLRESLTTQRIDHQGAGPDALVFATREGTAFLRENFRKRAFAPAVARANEQRAKAGLPPLPERLTPHRLRHTAISLWFAAGWELPRLMEAAGHSDSATTLKVYAHVMNTDPAEREKLRALVSGDALPILVPDQELAS
jgi:integrase